MNRNADSCDLCGLPLRGGDPVGEFGGRTLRFCCTGCRMVYAMLMEASDAPDPSRFQESELYRRCVAAGVVPAAATDVQGADTVVKDTAPAADSRPSDDRSLAFQCKVAGMWCPACSWVIENALARSPGVSDAVCDFATDRLRCRYDPTRADPQAIQAAVQALGYTPLPVDGEAPRARHRREFVRLVVSALLAVNVMMLSWALYSDYFTALSNADVRYISWPILVMATLVMLYGGAPLWRKSWHGLRAGAPGMETLVCLGAGSAYFYSLYNFWAGSWHLYFDTAAMLISLVLLGKLLESRARAGVRRDLEVFLALQPAKVRLCSTQFPNGRFADIAMLTPGDLFRVEAGEIVPADGRVKAGRGWVDEAAVTGESRSRTLAPGDSITSGTVLVKGDVTVTAQRVGPEAMLGQMIAVIEAGLTRRTPLESRSDRWLALFVPLMVSLAAATAVVTHGLGLTWEQAFVRGLTVLVMACPCALGIAIPLARIAGISGAGRRGILVRDFQAFERSTRIDHVVFDKTGTLTHGTWALERVEVRAGIDPHEAVALAAGLEEPVDHAIARAVTDYAREHGIAPAQVESVHAAESGVAGRSLDREVRFGRWDFVTRKARPEQGATSGRIFSPVFLSLDQEVSAVLWFGDRLREGAASLVRRLRDDGIRVHLVSGDAAATTAAVAEALAVPEAHGGLLPKDKADYVARLQTPGRRVVMVGDGINDAPALALADLSVAVYRDAALTRQAAHLTLMRGDPAQLLDFLNLARQVNAKVLQNLACAWIYNLIALPIAMSGWLNPLVAVTAMLLSSLTVIGNTLLLVRRK
jgi:heavy metal translocating P-type ATPase